MFTTDSGYVVSGDLTIGSISFDSTCASTGTLVSCGSVWPSAQAQIEERKKVKYLYKAYVIVRGEVMPELPPFIAKDETTATVKAIITAKANPDDAQVILQELGEVFDEDE